MLIIAIAPYFFKNLASAGTSRFNLNHLGVKIGLINKYRLSKMEQIKPT